MPNPPKILTDGRTQTVIVGIAVVGLAMGGFQMGRQSVAAVALSKHAAETQGESPNPSPRPKVLTQDHLGQGSVREIATVPFSELYDVLRSASHEQLLTWARDLERMPKGPRQRAAVTAYYKSLVQVNSRATIEAISHAEDLGTRDVAIDASLKATPESVWGDLAEMLESLPYQGRGAVREDVIWNWSGVDPEAASKFIERHPEEGEDDSRLYSLLSNWAQIDPASARNWLEADGSRQTKDAWRAFLGTWVETDRTAAMNFAIANASRPNFEKALEDIAYHFVRTSKEDATRLMLSLPAEQAKAAMKAVARSTGGTLLGAPEDFQRPPDEVARWMVSLPVELWSEGIGEVEQRWLKDDVAAATAWIDQLEPKSRDIAIASFCRTADFDSAGLVMTLGFSLSNSELRDKALGEFVRSRSPKREEALDAINDLALSDEQREYLRKVTPEDASGR